MMKKCYFSEFLGFCFYHRVFVNIEIERMRSVLESYIYNYLFHNSRSITFCFQSAIMSTNFIDCTEQEQAREIREFLKFLGAEIELTSNSSDVTDIVNNCNVVWKLDSATDIESVINSVVSLLLLLPEEILKPKIGEFCEVVVRDATESKKLNLCLKIFIVLFHALSEHSSLRLEQC